MLTITQTLQEPASYESSGSQNNTYQPSGTAENTAGAASDNYAVDKTSSDASSGKTSPTDPSTSLEKKIEEGEKEGGKETSSSTEKKNYGFFKKVWDVLNYKLW